VRDEAHDSYAILMEIATLAYAQLRQALEPVVVAMNRFAEQWDEALWRSYREKGEPYGESLEGRDRWWEEVAAAAGAMRLREEQRERESFEQSVKELGEQLLARHCDRVLRFIPAEDADG
jgi:hypothetical protein